MSPKIYATVLIFLTSTALVPLGAPGGLIWTLFMLSFLILIVTYYRSATRQGHSGLVILPVRKGPVGVDGLSNKLNSEESTIVAICAAYILGVLTGVGIAIGLSSMAAT